MVIISSREFRQNQRSYFDRVDQGEQIIVQRGKDKSYILMPVTEDDMYLNGAMVERIRASIKEADKGETMRITKPEEITELLGL